MPYSSFYKNPNTKDGYLNYCKPCNYQRYSPGIKVRRDMLLSKLQAIKLERGCADCGYNEYAAALDFDHLPGSVKKYRPSTMPAGTSWANIAAEIAKCEVVCANCHRVRTFKRLRAKTGEQHGNGSSGAPEGRLGGVA